MDIQIPAFGETDFSEGMSNRNTRIVNIPSAGESTFLSYCRLLEDSGYTKKEARRNGSHSYAAFCQGNTGVFLNLYGTLEELNIAIEENCGYFGFEDRFGEIIVPPQITQVYLEDFGMSYAIRLSDGRFIVIDGGWGFEPDIQELLRVLREGTPNGKPVVAAWFLTHPHRDHHLCFANIVSRYADALVIEKILLNYPEADDLERYPELQKEDWRVDGTASIYRVPQMLEDAQRLGIPAYEPHTGQIYRIGDATCEILSCLDDTVLISGHINPTSLVIRMELGGQVILWTADTAFSISRLAERYGSYLRADIMQVPHHGFQSGEAQGEILGYELVKPETCFLPVSDYHAYTEYCTYREGSRYVMTKLGIGELIVGDRSRTITLPYSPPTYAREELRKKYLAGLDNSGACTWVFTDLDTSNGEDFRFSFLNMTNTTAEVMIDIYFDDTKRNLSCIKACITPRSFRKLCITDENDIVANSAYFNSRRLDVLGIPENASFAVRFISSCPVVISNKNHSAAYRSENR